MRHPYLAGLLLGAAVLLSACGGGGGSAQPIIPIPTPVPTAAPATGTATIGPAGGSIAVTVATGAVKLTVPAGALATTSNISFVAYPVDNASKPFAKRRAAAAGTTFLLGFTIDDGGVPLYAPLQVSLTGPTATGTIRLAMYGTKSATYTDVDTASETGTTITNANAAAYVGISTASASNPYAFYSVASSTATPPPITLTATTTATQPIALKSSATFSGSGTDANGNPDAFIPTYTLSNASVGSLTPQTGAPYQVTLTTGTVSATGNIVVADAVRKVSSNVAVSVGLGSPYTYGGTWSQTFARVGQPSVTTTATLSEGVTVTSPVSFNSLANLSDYNAVDTSVANLTTTASTTDTYVGFNATSAQFLEDGYVFSDGAGSTTTSTYVSPQIMGQVSSTADSWTNNGATTIQENDASGEASTLIYAADGSYTENTAYPASSIDTGAAATVVENTDGSGSITLQPFDVVFAYTAPSSGSVTMAETAGGSPVQSVPITLWFPATPVLYSETDVNSAATTLPAGCKVGTSVPTSTNKVEQTINRLDTIFGFTETTVVDSYVAAGNGTVCSVMTDTLNNFYNLQGDTVTTFAWGSTSYQTTTTTQTLALQTAPSNSASGASHAMFRVARAAFEGRIATVRDRARRDALKHLMQAYGKGTVR